MSCGTLDPGRSFRISRTGFLPSLIPLPNGFCYPTRCLRQSTTPIDRSPSVWPLPLSLAATQGISVDFSSSGYLDVSVPRVPFHKLWIHLWMTVVHTAGFPHSEISGSKDICSSPKLIAAYHVFHRLSVPRHPPCALLRLTFVCPFPKKWLPPVPPSVENIRRMS